MDKNDPNPKSKRNQRGGSLFSGLICGGTEAAAAAGESAAAVEEGRKTENPKGNETRLGKVKYVHYYDDATPPSSGSHSFISAKARGTLSDQYMYIQLISESRLS